MFCFYKICLDGGLTMLEWYLNYTLNSVSYMDCLEKEDQRLPLIFTDILKDEINANDELSIYKGIKELVNKYSEDISAISIINELIQTLTGGASLGEIMHISKEEMSYQCTDPIKASDAFNYLSLRNA